MPLVFVIVRDSPFDYIFLRLSLSLSLPFSLFIYLSLSFSFCVPVPVFKSVMVCHFSVFFKFPAALLPLFSLPLPSLSPTPFPSFFLSSSLTQLFSCYLHRSFLTLASAHPSTSAFDRGESIAILGRRRGSAAAQSAADPDRGGGPWRVRAGGRGRVPIDAVLLPGAGRAVRGGSYCERAGARGAGAREPEPQDVDDRGAAGPEEAAPPGGL
jgi:hypothetical protein